MVSTPNLSLDRAAIAARPLLEQLMQLYCYDWSELVGLDVAEDGRYAGVGLDPYWRDDTHHPFVLRVDGHPAGFALVQSQSRLTGEVGVYDMAEFFVLRRYRRQGVGYAAACAVFDTFRGPWEVRQRSENVDATRFWRTIIDRYTSGAYTEVRHDEPGWSGVVQRFSNA
ncbi:MAG: GNAT family N-acetyltransferase [Polyangiaceae bacterium]